MIKVEAIRKEFKKTIKEPGILGSIKSLFHPHNETVIAVDDISFHVPKGEILGFIGPNGAGKSTVIKMLTGILTPTSGKCSINGKIPQDDRKTMFVKLVLFSDREPSCGGIYLYRKPTACLKKFTKYLMTNLKRE